MFGKNIKIKWNRYLEKMAKTNEKLYGNQRLDCCGMNKKPQSSDTGGPKDGR